MGNKKVFMIPPVSVFSRYARARGGMLRIAVCTEGVSTDDTVQKLFFSMLRLRKNWNLVGIFTDDSSSGKSRNDFTKLMKLCATRKVDMIMCKSQKDLPEKTTLLKEFKIPIYILEESRIIDHEMAGNSMFESLRNCASIY